MFQTDNACAYVSKEREGGGWRLHRASDDLKQRLKKGEYSELTGVEFPVTSHDGRIG